MLAKEELERYSRHFLLPGWDETKQEMLKKSTVFIAGAGGLGSPVAYYLASAGVGKLIICDIDRIEISNLNRQILYTTEDFSSLKTERAAARLLKLNPNIEIIPLNERIENADDFISESDIILDCLDNFESRLYLNRTAVKKRKPVVHGAVSDFSGQVTYIIPGQTPCLDCFIQEKNTPPTEGVTGAMAGIIGSIQALEAIKHITRTGELLKNRILFIDMKHLSFNTIKINRNPECKICSTIPDEQYTL